jgi:3-oxo-5-alpha-steroid 4-dehydrogenase 1
MVNARLGWVLMESPSVLVFAGVYLSSPRWGLGLADPVSLVFLGLWLGHYLYRSFAFPFLMRDPGRMPILILGSGVFFNLINAGINSRYLFVYAPVYASSWLADPRFIGGVALFLAGFAIHAHSDHVLRGLRRPEDPPKTYRVPQAGLFRFVSAPNYLGEMLQWGGFALATWSLPALAFFLWTIANLAPRARANHQWYQERFPDYPKKRKALIPFVL